MKTLLEAALLSVLAVFAPIKGMLIVTGVLILSDLVLGLSAAYRRKEPITSAGFRRTLVKLVVYEFALAIGYLAEHYLLSEVPITKLISGVVALTECKSILENLNSISGMDLFKSVLEKLGSQNDAGSKEQ